MVPRNYLLTMKGYHYTSFEAWERIKREGLIPQPLHKPELSRYFRKIINGIWIWKKRMFGGAHIGSILFQVATKQTLKVVCLEVSYNPQYILKYKGKYIILYHNGLMGDWYYHSGKQTSIIITNPIPPSKIKLVKIYDLKKLLK